MHLSAIPKDFPLRAGKHLNSSFLISSSFQLPGSILIYIFRKFISCVVCCFVWFWVFFNSFLRTEKIWMVLRLFFLFFLDLEVICIRVLNGSWEYNWSVCLGSGVQTKTMKKIFLYVNWKWMGFFSLSKTPQEFNFK